MRSRWLFGLATSVAFVVLTVVWAAPLVTRLTTTYLETLANPTPLSRADALLTSWILAWGAHALRTNPLHLFHANILHPLPWTFAFSENLLAGAIAVLPVDVVWGNPVLDHNVLLLSTFVVLGTGTALLAHELGASLPAAWLAGVIVAFDPLRFGSIDQVHSLSTQWMPFALLALHRCIRTGRGAVAVAVTVLLVTLSSVYYAYFFFLALAVFLSMEWALGCPSAPGGRWRALGGVGVAGVVTAIVLSPYMIARDVYALGRESGQAFFFGAKATTYLGAVVHPILYFTQRYVVGENTPTVIGLGTFGLFVVGLVAGAAADRGGRRTTTVYLAVAVVIALVSLGPLMQWNTLLDMSRPGPWLLLSAVVPGFAALRVPMRACHVAVLVVGIVAALGAERLWRSAGGRTARAIVFVLLVGIGVAEGWRPPLVPVDVPWAATGIRPVYRWLARQPGHDAVAELPLGLPASDAAYMVFSATHWHPLLNGYSGFTPTISFFRGFLFGFPTPASVRLLHDLGVRWVIAHTSDMGAAQAGMCALGHLGPNVAIAYRDASGCVFEIRGADPAPPTPPDQAVSLDGVTATTSDGTPAPAAVDGDLDTHWVEPVNERTEGWLQIDLPAPHAIARVVIQLGSHFGEFLRQWRIETSLDGQTWQPAATEMNAMPPVVDMMRNPTHLATELRLPVATQAQHVRIVRPGAGKQLGFDLWPNWGWWGVHELQIYESVASPERAGLP